MTGPITLDRLCSMPLRSVGGREEGREGRREGGREGGREGREGGSVGGWIGGWECWTADRRVDGIGWEGERRQAGSGMVVVADVSFVLALLLTILFRSASCCRV